MKYLFILTYILNFSIFSQAFCFPQENKTALSQDFRPSTDAFEFPFETCETLFPKIPRRNIDLSGFLIKNQQSESGKIDVISFLDNNPFQATDQYQSNNKVAILPFRFIADDRETLEEGGYQAQDEAFAYLLNKIKSDYSLQSLQETNAILLRENITIDNYRMYTAGDFCRILGVGYVLSGNVSQVRTSSTSTENSHTSVNNNNKKPGSNQGSSINTHGSSSSRENYSNTVKIEITDAAGNVTFSQSHKAFAGSSSQTYLKAIRYLLKRTPLIK